MNFTFDIETIPDQSEDAIERASDLVKVPSNYKDPIKIADYKLKNAEDAHLKTGLNGLYGEICSIAWAVEDDDVAVIYRDRYDRSGIVDPVL